MQNYLDHMKNFSQYLLFLVVLFKIFIIDRKLKVLEITLSKHKKSR